MGYIYSTEQLFSKKTLWEIIECQRCDLVKKSSKDIIKLIKDPFINQDVFDFAFDWLLKTRRNEYVYKNLLINKVLLGSHSIKTTTALAELPVGKSIADFVLINGKAIAYEIKSPLDNTYRLSTQIEDYLRAFNHVIVIGNEKNIKEIVHRYHNTSIGIWMLNSSARFSQIKKPEEDSRFLDHGTIFSILRKREFEAIILKYYGALPAVNQFAYYRTCFDLFKRLEILDAYSAFLRVLKSRNSMQECQLIKVPKSIRSLAYFMQLSDIQVKQLDTFLHQPIGG